ncbi:MAG: hypothetical protein ACQEQ7_09410 [Thermodesulfobacteriota bacterium]
MTVLKQYGLFRFNVKRIFAVCHGTELQVKSARTEVSNPGNMDIPVLNGNIFPSPGHDFDSDAFIEKELDGIFSYEGEEDDRSPSMRGHA